jgi:hypothetical protein
MIIIFGGPLTHLLRWREPERADRGFYQETKYKLAHNPGLQFEPEYRFWTLYWPYFISFFLFGSALFYLFVIVKDYSALSEATNIMVFMLCISLYHTIFGITKIIYYFRYRRQEKIYHRRFLDAVKKSGDYEDFTEMFYEGKSTSHE